MALRDASGKYRAFRQRVKVKTDDPARGACGSAGEVHGRRYAQSDGVSANAEITRHSIEDNMNKILHRVFCFAALAIAGTTPDMLLKPPADSWPAITAIIPGSGTAR